MPTAAKKIAELPTPEDEGSAERNPVLAVGGQRFECKTDRLPFGTMLKYAEADMDLMSIRRLLIKVFDEETLEQIWDAFDDVGINTASDAIAKMIGEFSERPTQRS